VPDWSRGISPWQRWLEPHFRTREAVERGMIPERECEFLSQRFGWYGGPPRTLAEVGDAFALSPIRVVVFEQRALRAARLAARGTLVS
jgi:DNA-directed RNA polymerase sigma subunit (sigma70/sigma32)